MDLTSDSTEKKKLTFVSDSDNSQHSQHKSEACEEPLNQEEILEQQNLVRTRSKQISFVWNQGFKNRDRVLRRLSLHDPRELQRRREFCGKRVFGENEEFTEAMGTKRDVQQKHNPVVRRHSHNDLRSDEKWGILHRASFATRLTGGGLVADEATENDSITISSSDSSINEEEGQKNVVYRVSFIDAERVEAIQTLLSKNKSKQSIIVHQRPADARDDTAEGQAPTPMSCVRIISTCTSSEDRKKQLALGESSGGVKSAMEDSFEEEKKANSSKVELNSLEAREYTTDSCTSYISQLEPPKKKTVDGRCTTDERTSIGIRIEPALRPQPQPPRQPLNDENNEDHWPFSLAPLCGML